jgi:hypothetical protein
VGNGDGTFRLSIRPSTPDVGRSVRLRSARAGREGLTRDTSRGPQARSRKLLRKAGLQLNEHIVEPGDIVFRHACKLGLEGIVSKRKDSTYRSGRSPDWLKMKNPDAPAVKREAEEDWGKEK